MQGLVSACPELANYYNYVKVYHNNCYAAEDGTVLRDNLKGELYLSCPAPFGSFAVKIIHIYLTLGFHAATHVHLPSIKSCSLPFKASLSRRQISSDWLTLANRRLAQEVLLCSQAELFA